MKISQLVQWAQLKWHKLHQPSHTSQSSSISVVQRPGKIQWKISSPHQSYLTSSRKGRLHYSWPLRTTRMPGIKLLWPELLCSAPAPPECWEVYSCPWERQVQVTAFICLCLTKGCFYKNFTSFYITFFIIHLSQRQFTPKLLYADPVFAE